MANEETCSTFHNAKSSLEAAMEDFKTAAELDDRDIKDELTDCIYDVFGAPLQAEFTNYNRQNINF